MARDYEYIAYNGSTEQCQSTVPGVGKVLNGVQIVTNESQSIEDAMAAYVYYEGPIAVAVWAATSEWQHYSSGILECPTPNKQVDHGVTIVGYGEENGTKYWKVKNSWTPIWGEKGYLKLRRGTNECGVATQPVAVTVEEVFV